LHEIFVVTNFRLAGWLSVTIWLTEIEDYKK